MYGIAIDLIIAIQNCKNDEAKILSIKKEKFIFELKSFVSLRFQTDLCHIPLIIYYYQKDFYKSLPLSCVEPLHRTCTISEKQQRLDS